ncbi:protein DpdF [Chloroflexota bacterium]
MTNNEFELIRTLLIDPENFEAPTDKDFETPCYKRLASAINSNQTSAEDLMALVRHVLRRKSEETKIPQTVRVPANNGWPTIKQWAMHGVLAVSHSSNTFLLKASPWRPNWLPLTQEYCPESAVYAGTKRLNIEECVGDPFLVSLGSGYTNYLSVGQRQAVRATIMAPPGSTLLVSLPTGMGKSLCAHILSRIPFIDGTDAGVVVVVVPTIALALDQQRVLQHIYPNTAYRGTINEEIKQSNSEIWKGIANGTQRIVFTSPESLIGSLRGVIGKAAREGLLKALVIDETHMVDQWGDEFRSSFQEIAGLRRALLRECPSTQFRTLLLSATVTESTLVTLRVLFGQPGPFEHISAVQLRPEPSYWFSYCEGYDIQSERIIDAIHNLPRPLILYTTKVADAVNWYSRLCNMGYRRIRIMTGNTKTKEREDIINSWSKAETDIVVATSAFGLGVDQRDVRSIIHACIPETIDRYYQEVGRGGRDGNASISLVIYTREDLVNARSIGKKKIISVKLGLQRWTRMFNNKKILDDWRIDIPLIVARKYKHDPSSDHNISWNISTLTLMARAGMIALDDLLPTATEINNSDEETEGGVNQPGPNIVEQKKNRRIVHILTENHQNIGVWDEKVEPIRKRTAKVSNNQHKLLLKLIRDECCVADIFEQTYRIDEEVDGHHITVANSCGGCGFCRKNNKEPYSNSVSKYATPIPWSCFLQVGKQLETYLAGNNVLALFYDSNDTIEDQQRTQCKYLDWLINQGVTSIVAPKFMLELFRKNVEKITSKPIIFHSEYNGLKMPKVPTAVFYSSNHAVDDLDSWLDRMRIFHHEVEPYILILSDDSTDPQRQDRTLRKYLPCPKVTQEIFSQREII